MRVTDPDGQGWRVSRRWVPWRLRTRVPDLPVAEVLFRLDDDAVGGPRSSVPPGSNGDDDSLVTVLLRLVALVLLVPLLAMALLAVAEVLLLLLVLPLAVAGRVLLGRHWVVEVRAGREAVWEADAGDWARSGQAMQAIAASLQRGLCPWDPSAPGPRGRVLRDWVLGYGALDPAAPTLGPGAAPGAGGPEDGTERAGRVEGVRRALRRDRRRPGAPGRPPAPGSAGPGS